MPAQTVDLDQAQQNAVSDLSLHCLWFRQYILDTSSVIEMDLFRL